MSSSFCGFCGAKTEGGKFCTSCGREIVVIPTRGEVRAAVPAAPAPPAPAAQLTKLAAAATPTPTVLPIPAQQTKPAEVAATQPLPPSSAPSPADIAATPEAATKLPVEGSPVVGTNNFLNPFKGVAGTDFVRDGVAIVCLLSVFGIAWDFEGKGGNHWWVTIAALMSLASLATPFAIRAQLVPGWGPAESLIVKSVVNLPAMLCIVVALVNELVKVDDLESGGLGPALGLLGTGAVLAVQPRAFDDTLGSYDRLWRLSGLSLGALGALIGVVTWVVYLATEDEIWDAPLSTIGGAIFYMLAVFVLLAVVPLAHVIARDIAWIRVYMLVGASVLIVALLATMGDESGSSTFISNIGKFKLPIDGGVFLIPIGAAVLISRPALRDTVVHHPAIAWISTIKAALLAVTTVAAAEVVGEVLFAAGSDYIWGGAYIAVSALTGGIALIAAVSLALVSHDPDKNRPAVLGLQCLAVLLGIVVIAVGHGSSSYAARYGWEELAVLIILPAAILTMYTIPASLRVTLGPLLPKHNATPMP